MHLRPRLVPLAGAAVLWACAGTGMSLSMQQSIPRGASGVRMRSALTPARMFEFARTIFTEKGFSFSRLDESAMSLQTDALPVGSSKAPLRLRVSVEAMGEGSVLTATGETLVSPGIWGPAANTSEKAKLGFQEMVMLLGELPHLEIQYPVEGQ
ncbi:MAG: hypothetical protein HY560_01720 [Gemmatimonadetes bacterium]|nr:hypothetical protein [Gemmatimonadota bacterium]